MNVEQNGKSSGNAPCCSPSCPRWPINGRTKQVRKMRKINGLYKTLKVRLAGLLLCYTLKNKSDISIGIAVVYCHTLGCPLTESVRNRFSSAPHVVSPSQVSVSGAMGCFGWHAGLVRVSAKST